MTSSAATVEEYLAGLPDDRRAALSAVRDVILANLPEGFEEIIQYGMIGYAVPHSLYPAGYHCDPKQPLPFAALGSQKNHMSLHLLGVYMHAETAAWFHESYAASGKKMDMGKGCVRFKKLDDLPLDVVGALFARIPVEDYISRYEAALSERRSRPK